MKQIKSIKYFEGQCCNSEHVENSQNLSQNLTCIICYQIMTKPVTLSCGQNGHTFGMACLKQWIKNKQTIFCPYCRGKADTWSVSQALQNQINKVQIICSYCKQWKGSLTNAQKHKLSCMQYYEHLLKTLDQVVKQQIKELDIEINPHLKAQHSQIYEKYVQNWEWLKADTRNWKWWWWCSNPWWKQISCKCCNMLWHKYQKKIDLLQMERISLIQTINIKFVQVAVRDLFAQQS